MKYSELILKCIELIETYNENIMTPDSHAQEFLAKNNKCEDTERVFLKQIFYGVQRYRQFLKVSNNMIFQAYSTMTNRKNDSTLFLIFTYLICFRLDELPFAEFKKIVLSQDSVKMNVLLEFIFDLQMLQEKVVDLWADHLEKPYLEDKLLPKLLERRQKCEELILKINELATGKKGMESLIGDTQENIEDFNKNMKKTTVAKEFKLTKPKPKLLPEPIKIQVGFKANPIPKQNKSLKAIDEGNKKRRTGIKENIKKFYDQKKADEFTFQTSKRPSNLPKIKQEVELEYTKQLKKVVPRPMPKYNEVEVPLTVAAILLEEKKMKEKIEEEEGKMRDLEINMRDESEFTSWQKQMKEKDSYQAMEAQQRRKIEMQLAREAATKACEQNVQEKKLLVEDMRLTAQELQMEREQIEEENLQEKKKIIEEVQEIQGSIAQEREKVVEKNKRMRDEEVEERKRVQEKKKEEEKVEMQKKRELIQEIRELEQKIRVRPKQEIEYVSIGLLEEYTLEQLRSRLTEAKQERKEEEERRREENNKKKDEFKSTLTQKKGTIMAARESLAKQKEEERLRKKAEAEAEKVRVEEVKRKSLVEYRRKEEEKATAKKREKEKLARELKETEQKRMFLMQGQAAQEANAFKNLEKGEQREILDRQNTKLIQEFKKQSISDGERKILADQNKKAAEKKIEFNKLYNQQGEFNNRMAEEVQQEDQIGKAMNYHQVRDYEQKHNQNMTKTNPFKGKIAEMSLTNAKNSNLKKSEVKS